MPVLHGTVKDGKIEFPEPTDLPDGTPVQVIGGGPALAGMDEDDWDNSPEAIAAWHAWLDGLEPLILTPDDEARSRAAREDQKRYDWATGNARAHALAAMFG